MELVNNVLNMNKLESGEMKPENKPFDLIELLTETASIVEMQGQEYAIHFQMQMGKHKYRHLIRQSALSETGFAEYRRQCGEI